MSKFADLYLDPETIPKDITIPNTDGRLWLCDGQERRWEGKCIDVFSPILDSKGNRIKIGEYAMMSQKEALESIDAAHKAYANGLGEWPSMLPKDRIKCVEKFLEELEANKKEIVNLIMWEICKTKADATKEVERTIEYIKDSINALKNLENTNRDFVNNSGILAQVRRVPLGTCLCLAPFNYPFNETYTSLFPALLMGNTIVLKTPRTGGLCHTPTVRIFQKCFPKGVVNIIHGSGKETLPPIMDSGKVDIFAFIGTSKAAVDLQKLHPNPHRLRVTLGLDAKNPAVICPDADINVTVKECILGSLSFNGQRCTALKVIYVHESRAQEFVSRFSAAVDNLKMGLPWQEGVAITPLPEPDKPAFLKDLIDDAVSKGAKIANQRGGQMDGPFVVPTVLFPVSKDMRAFHEEQFGPLVPIVPYKDFKEVIGYMVDSSFGQQASIFSQDPKSISPILDILALQVSRVNINAQCQRGPDILPFTGRKNSAHGTLSVTDALRTMSIRTIIATKSTSDNQKIFSEIMDTKQSKYLRSEYLF